MNQPVSINPDGLRKAADQFDAITETTKNILDTLQAGCTSEGEPWGDDKPGKKFADGDKGYIANRDGTFKGMSSVVDVFGQNRDNLRDSAKTFEENESQTANATPRLREVTSTATPRKVLEPEQATQPRQYRLEPEQAAQPRQYYSESSVPYQPVTELQRVQDVEPKAPEN